MRCRSPHWRLLGLALLGLAVPGVHAEDQPGPDQILSVMRRAADWQLAAPLKKRIPIDAWESGVFYTGVMALGDIAPDATYHDAMLKLGAGQQWKTKPGAYNADNYVIGQTYTELYLQKHDPVMILPLRAQFDDILGHPAGDDLDLRKPGVGHDNWSWCDTLFMGPGAWMRMSAATGKPEYLDFAVRNWWHASDYLYDKEEHLYYRDCRFFDLRGANGKKIFWARGNGWVLGGLVRVLQFLPDNHPDRPRFLSQYREMVEKLSSLQNADGTWHASLLAPDEFDLPEVSGTGLFTYGLAWGVNRGLLDRAKYEPAIWKAWNAMTRYVGADGRLSQIQSGGDRPHKFDPNNNDSFGTGAFLLAGSEVYRLALLGAAPRVRVSIGSSLDDWREDETISVPLAELRKRKPDVKPEDLAVLPDLCAMPIVSQVEPSTDSLLFQSDFAPRQSRHFEVVLKADLPKPVPVNRTYARFVPERLDDFAWENERTAHRMYGPALEKTGEISSGVDLWAKRSHKPLIDQWYKRGDYHEDHGDGGDFYKTGPTRGCGGLGVWAGGRLVASKNYVSWKILANGPVRSIFQLEYAPWEAGGMTVRETKTISLDVGSNLNCLRSDFTMEGGFHGGGLTVAVGLTRRPAQGGFKDSLAEGGWMSYWSPADPGNGELGCAVVFPAEINTEDQAVDTPENYLALTTLPRDHLTLTYYAGGGWSKGDFKTQEEWERYVRVFAERLGSPLKVAVLSDAK